MCQLQYLENAGDNDIFAIRKAQHGKFLLDFLEVFYEKVYIFISRQGIQVVN